MYLIGEELRGNRKPVEAVEAEEAPEEEEKPPRLLLSRVAPQTRVSPELPPKLPPLQLLPP